MNECVSIYSFHQQRLHYNKDSTMLRWERLVEGAILLPTTLHKEAIRWLKG